MKQYFFDKLEIFICLFNKHFARHFESHWRETWRHTCRRTIHRFPCRYLPPGSHLDHWSVNTRWTSCIPAFTLSFQTENLEFTAVNEWNPAFCGRFPAFSETVNTAESRKIACIPAFTDRLPLGKLRVIPTFASSFLAFSFIFRDSEFK